MPSSDLALTRRQAVAIVALAVALLFTGCSGLFGDEPALPDGDEAVERLNSAGIYNVTMTVESTFGNESTETRIERTIRPSTGEQYQVTIRNGTRTTVVSNGTIRWVYRPGANEVQRIQTNGSQQQSPAEQIRKLVDNVSTDDETGISIVPISPLFGSGSTAGNGSYSETIVGSEPTMTQYRGVETVNGRETHVIRMESPPDAENERQQTIYYDSEYFVPMKAEYEITVRGEHVEGEMRVQSVEFSPSVDDSIFEFDPPENATVITTTIREYENYTALRRASDGHVPDPDVPSEFEFELGTLTDRGLTLQYTDGPATISLTRSTRGEVRADSERIDRQGRTYYYSDQFRTKAVQWRCDDTVYTLSAELERDRLLTVGGSVDCPTNN